MTSDWDESDVELAERYVEALEKIKRLTGGQDWSETDVELAERYAEALQTIQQSQPV